MGNLNKLLLFDIFCWWNISMFVSSYCHLISARNMLSSLSNHPASSEYWLVGSLLPSNLPTYVWQKAADWRQPCPHSPLWLPPGQLLWRGREMVEKDVEAEAGTNMCGDNLVVCGAVAEGLVVFIFILVVCLVVGFSAYWDLVRFNKVAVARNKLILGICLRLCWFLTKLSEIVCKVPLLRCTKRVSDNWNWIYLFIAVFQNNCTAISEICWCPSQNARSTSPALKDHDQYMLNTKLQLQVCKVYNCHVFSGYSGSHWANLPLRAHPSWKVDFRWTSIHDYKYNPLPTDPQTWVEIHLNLVLQLVSRFVLFSKHSSGLFKLTGSVDL